jgi:hypothetical protein
VDKSGSPQLSAAQRISGQRAQPSVAQRCLVQLKRRSSAVQRGRQLEQFKLFRTARVPVMSHSRNHLIRLAPDLLVLALFSCCQSSRDNVFSSERMGVFVEVKQPFLLNLKLIARSNRS